MAEGSEEHPTPCLFLDCLSRHSHILPSSGSSRPSPGFGHLLPPWETPSALPDIAFAPLRTLAWELPTNDFCQLNDLETLIFSASIFLGTR